MWGVTPWYCFSALFVLRDGFNISWDTKVEPGVWWLTFYPSLSNIPVGYFAVSQNVWKFIFSDTGQFPHDPSLTRVKGKPNSYHGCRGLISSLHPLNFVCSTLQGCKSPSPPPTLPCYLKLKQEFSGGRETWRPCCYAKLSASRVYSGLNQSEAVAQRCYLSMQLLTLYCHSIFHWASSTQPSLLGSPKLIRLIWRLAHPCSAQRCVTETHRLSLS